MVRVTLVDYLQASSSKIQFHNKQARFLSSSQHNKRRGRRRPCYQASSAEFRGLHGDFKQPSPLFNGRMRCSRWWIFRFSLTSERKNIISFFCFSLIIMGALVEKAQRKFFHSLFACKIKPNNGACVDTAAAAATVSLPSVHLLFSECLFSAPTLFSCSSSALVCFIILSSPHKPHLCTHSLNVHSFAECY